MKIELELDARLSWLHPGWHPREVEKLCRLRSLSNLEPICQRASAATRASESPPIGLARPAEAPPMPVGARLNHTQCDGLN